MRGELLVVFLPLALIAQVQPTRTVTSQAQRLGSQPVPGFQNGYLYFVDRAIVRAYSPEGFPILTTVVQIPDADDVWGSGLAVDTDGTFAVAVSYEAPAPTGGNRLLQQISAARRICAYRIVSARSLCFADDHSLWTFGSQRGGGDYKMLHHFAADRKV